MHKILKLIFIIVLLDLVRGCAFESKHYESDWNLLSESQKFECSEWLWSELGAGVSEVKKLVIEGKQNFLIELKNRKGAKEYYFVSEKEFLSPQENIKFVPIDPQHDLLGILNSRKNIYFMTASYGKDQTYELTFWTESMQKIASYSDFTGVLEGMQTVNNTTYLSFYTKKYNFYTIDNTSFQLRKNFSIENIDRPVFLGEKKLILYALGSKSNLSAIRFAQFSNLGINPLFDLRFLDQIETWKINDLQSNDKELKLATVTGDSLLGQGKLHVTGIDINNEKLRENWFQDLDLNGAHISDITWFRHNGEIFVGFLSWFDAEKIFRIFKVAKNCLQELDLKGVFSKDATILFGFEYNHDNYIMVRSKSTHRFVFQMCRLRL